MILETMTTEVIAKLLSIGLCLKYLDSKRPWTDDDQQLLIKVEAEFNRREAYQSN